jgi:hypothetical protein
MFLSISQAIGSIFLHPVFDATRSRCFHHLPNGHRRRSNYCGPKTTTSFCEKKNYGLNGWLPELIFPDRLYLPEYGTTLASIGTSQYKLP